MQDQNPERRNLLVASIGFLLYFLAGGTLADDVVRIQLINLKFENPAIFATFAWMILLWFLFRYWLLHSGKFEREFKKELLKFSNESGIRSEVERRLGEPIVDDDQEGPHQGAIRPKKLTLEVPIVWASRVTRHRDTGQIGSISGQQKKDPSAILLSGLKGRWLASKIFMRCFFLYPSFSNYAIPYVVFTCVLIAAVASFV